MVPIWLLSQSATMASAVDDFVVIEARISEPVARLIDGDCRAGSATVSDEDQNHVQGVVHLGDTNKVGAWLLR
jgi:hypothetical protein